MSKTRDAEGSRIARHSGSRGETFFLRFRFSSRHVQLMIPTKVAGRDSGRDNVESSSSIPWKGAVSAPVYIQWFPLHFRMVNNRRPTEEDVREMSRLSLYAPYRRATRPASRRWTRRQRSVSSGCIRVICTVLCRESRNRTMKKFCK